MAETEEEKRRRTWLESQNQLAPGEDPIDRMLSDMAWAKIKGWRRVRTADGGCSVFPETATDEDEWEQRCQEMTDQQEVIELADKPLERSRMRSETAVAAFETHYADPPIENFHEVSPASTEYHRTKRGS